MPDIVWIQEVLFPIMGMVLGGFTLYGVYRIWNRHLDRTHERHLAQGGGDLRGEVQRLRERVEALDGTDRRLEELEERLDFAERLLVQREEPPALRGGSE